MKGGLCACWYVGMLLASLTCVLALPEPPLSNVRAPSGQRLALLEPKDGAYFGVTMNNSVSLSSYVQQIGLEPVVFGTFTHFPLRTMDIDLLHNFLKQVADMGAIAMITLEPYSGLSAVNDKSCRMLVDLLASYERAGISFIIRFGQEMNGGWFPWCQKPTEFVDKFQLLAGYIHAFTCRSAMLWAPNNGGGYPFDYGSYTCTTSNGCRDFDLLDTNGDGELSMEDDMYSPYYPGDDYVDWVGMTLYHWGQKSPWGKNVVPEPASFFDKLTGNYDGANGNETAVPDFYAMFCNDSVHAKPLVIPEVAALFNPSSSCCDDELKVKRAWWRQVFNIGGNRTGGPDPSTFLPRLKMVVWFDQTKRELGLNIDWTLSNNATVIRAFQEDLEVGQWRKGEGQRYWKQLNDFQKDEALIDPSPAPRNITIITNASLTVTLGAPEQGHLSEVGVEIISVDENFMPQRRFGEGTKVVRRRRSWTVDIDVIFKEPQDASWQQGTLYYSAFVRSLEPSMYNRSEECSIRSPLMALEARRGGTRPPAPLHPAALVLHEGEDVLLLFLFLLLCTVLFVLARRQQRARRKLSDIHAGALRFAAAQGNLEVMEEIARKDRFDVDASVLGFTALHAAVINGQTDGVLWLLSHGAKVEGTKQEGWHDTALHYAAANGRADVAYVLLMHGANASLKNFHGALPADLALDGGHRDLASGLYKAAFRRAKSGPPHQCQLAPGDRRGALAGLKEPLLGASFAELDALADGMSFQDWLTVDKMRRSWSPTSVLDDPDPLLGAGRDDGAGPPSSPSSSSDLADPLLVHDGSAWDGVQSLVERAYYGAGTPGAELTPGTYMWRTLAIMSQGLGCVYFAWRALRSLNRAHLGFSILFYLCELCTFAPSFLFCLEVWSPVERERRLLSRTGIMEADFPAVDAYVVCYNEPVAIIEATVCATLNMIYPAAKLAVHVLDDGKREEVEVMCAKLSAEMAGQKGGPYGRGWARLRYATRAKVAGVPHHAKAGNINTQLLKGRAAGTQPGAFVVVFDCDMIPKPEFLDTVMGHFYELDPQQGWRPRTKLAFVQTPQDFYNVEQNDPMGHRAAFFYGPMMQGRDGAGACPCVGTGVVFRRDALLSVGGQALGSITEDYNSAMTLMSSGFASIYLNERLTFGLAPDDIESVFKQRLRWAMGSLQILCRDNPLFKPALSASQSLLFFQSAFQYCLALPTLVISLAPVLYLYLEVGPISARVQEFCCFFAAYYAANRVMLWAAHRGVPNKGHEMWRGSQSWVWSVPNNLWACWKVFTSELRLFKWLGALEIGFAVTKKDAANDWRSALRIVWMFAAYYVAVALALSYHLIRCCLGLMSTAEILAQAVASAWAILICLYLWPPLTMALPWHRPGPPGAVLWDESPPELLDALHSHGHHHEPGVGHRTSEEAAGSRQGIWQRLWSWRSAGWSSRVEPPPHAGAAGSGPSPAPRLHHQHSLGGRPTFNLMRRVRDSMMFALVNGITLAALVVAGLLYALLVTPPVQAFVRSQLAPYIAAPLRAATRLMGGHP